MEKLRILNIFIIAFLISLGLQYWFFPQPKNTPIVQDIILSVESDSIVVPNIPKITVRNTTTGALTINTCQDITLSINSQQTTSIAKDYPDFCKIVSLSTSSGVTLSFEPLYKVFAGFPGQYIVTLKTSL